MLCSGSSGILALFLLTPSATLWAQQGEWVRQFGTPDPDAAYGVAADVTGVYVAGYTSGRGFAPGVPTPGSSFSIIGASYGDAYARKYGTDGSELWTDQIGAGIRGFASGVVVDATGVYVVGSVQGALSGQSYAGGWDAFVRKYDSNGVILWTRQIGTSLIRNFSRF